MNFNIFSLALFLGFISTNLIAQESSVLNPVQDFEILEDNEFLFSIPDTTFYYSATADDEYQVEILALSNRSEWIYNLDSLTITGVPTNLDTGIFKFKVSLTNLGVEQTSDTFNITVLRINDKPLLIESISGQIYLEGFGSSTISFKNSFYDEEDSTNLNYFISQEGENSIVAEIVENSIQITESGIGESMITLKAEDQEGETTEILIPIIVYFQDSLAMINTGNTGSSGLVDNNVTSVYIDDNKTTWFGTEYGISSLDTNEIWSNRVPIDYYGAPNGIWKDSNGSINISYYSGIIQTYNGMEWLEYNITDSIPSLPYIYSTTTDENNSIWIIGHDANIGTATIAKNNGTKWEVVTSLDIDEQLTEIRIYNGNIYSSTTKTILQYQNSTWLEIALNLGEFEFIKGFEIINNDSLIIASSDRLLAHSPIGVSVLQDYISIDQILKVQNSLLILSDNRISKYNNGHYQDILELPQPVSDSLRVPLLGQFIKEANDSILYIGTTAGVYKISNILSSPQIIRHHHTLDGLPSNGIWDSWQMSSDSIWFMTNNGASQYSNNKWQYLNFEYLPIYQAKNGVMWGAYGQIFNDRTQTDLITYSNNTWEFIKHEDSNIINPVGIAEDSNHNIYVSNNNGIGIYDGTNWNYITKADGLSENETTRIFIDSKDRIWVDYELFDLGISMYDGQSWSEITEADGLADKAINGFMEASNGNIWILTQQGISIYDLEGDITSITRNDGLILNYVEKTIEDANKSIWILYDFTNPSGISRIDSTGNYYHYTIANGLPSNDIRSLSFLANGNSSGRTNSDSGLRIQLGTGKEGIGEFNIQYLTSADDTGDGNNTDNEVVSGITSSDTKASSIYPNPFSNYVLINLETSKPTLIKITNLTGEQIYETVIEGYKETFRLNTSTWLKGGYIINVITNGNSFSKKIIK